MPFSEFWSHNLTEEELKAIRILEQQILALDKEWLNYEKHNFTDWNSKFKGLNISSIHPSLQIPLRDAKIEKREFEHLWKKTIYVFTKTTKLIEKGKSHDAIITLFNQLSQMEKMIEELEHEERRTVTYLRQYENTFKHVFDSNYGEGFYEKEVMENYEVRFRILEILKNEFELIRYLLSDVI